VAKWEGIGIHIQFEGWFEDWHWKIKTKKIGERRIKQERIWSTQTKNGLKSNRTNHNQKGYYHLIGLGLGGTWGGDYLRS
jgi:hypothetical protein